MAGDVEVVSGVAAFALVSGPAVLLLAITGGLQSHRRSLRRQATTERASLEVDPLSFRAGPVALSGTVETLDGDVDGAPVKVSLLDGKIEARPFFLKLTNGLRVRVEPGARPVLRDGPEGKFAALTAGERVFVRGVLKAPILDELHAERAVLAAPRWGRVHLSTHAFSGELDRQVRDLGFQPAMLLLTAIATQLFYVGFYVEAVVYWLGGKEPPTIVVAFYFWIALVVGSVLLGSLLSSWEERPWRSR